MGNVLRDEQAGRRCRAAASLVMGNDTERLPSNTSSDVLPPWDVADERLRELVMQLASERASEVAISGLRDICGSYLQFRHAELGAQKFSEAVDRWRKVRKALEEFTLFCEGSLLAVKDKDRISDATHFVEGLMFDALEENPLLLAADDLLRDGLDQSAGAERNTQLALTPQFLMRLSSSLRLAVRSVDETMAGEIDGFHLGSAMRDWHRQMTAWAIEHGFPSKPGSDNYPSKFSIFLYALKQTFPKSLRPDTTSEVAMPKALRRSLKDWDR